MKIYNYKHFCKVQADRLQITRLRLGLKQKKVADILFGASSERPEKILSNLENYKYTTMNRSAYIEYVYTQIWNECNKTGTEPSQIISEIEFY